MRWGRRGRVASSMLGLSLMLAASSETPRIGNAPLYAVGVYTQDVDETARQYERVFGVVPADFKTASVVTPSGAMVKVRMDVVFFPNFYVKLQQPVSENGPYAEDLRAYGRSIQNIQLKVDGKSQDFPAIRAGMVRNGGRWTLGSASDPWAYVDFKETLGVTLEPASVGASIAVQPAPHATHAPLGTMPVTHVGFAVTNASQAAKAYSKVFGIPLPPLTEVRDLQYPPGSTWNMAAHLQVARWRQGNVSVELIESVGGPTPWSEFVEKRKGSGALLIGFDVGDRMDEVLRELQDKGGKWIYGRPGGTQAYIDFRETLGLVVEITGTPRSARGVLSLSLAKDASTAASVLGALAPTRWIEQLFD